MDGIASMAVEAFREVERVRLLLDKKEKALSQAVRVMAVECDDESKAAYFDATQSIIDEYEVKRQKL